MIRKIAQRIVLLVIILISMNYIYEFGFQEQDIQHHSEVINLVRAVPNDADIIYIGESSNITARYDDIDKRPISDFVADHFPNLKLADITKPASHAGIFKILLDNIPQSSQITTVIVTLNLRSFNSQWIYSNLETSLQKSMVLLKPKPPLINRFLLSFKSYDIKTEREREKQIKSKWRKDIYNFPYKFPYRDVMQWDKWMADYGVKDQNGNIDYPQTELACHYIKTYGFQIDTLHNPRIQDFNDIIELAKTRKWNLVFNLLAENTEKAELLVGQDILYLIDENSKLLKNYYQSKGVLVVDNIHAVSDEQFIDQNWTTEHYAETGRKKIAQNVANTVKLLYPDKYVNVDYPNTVENYFFNNCDNQVVWGQMQSITDEIAYSGEKSSKTGKGEDYSITFEYPLKQIPDSLKNKIIISFKVNQESLDHEAKLVIQADGTNLNSYWDGIELKQQIAETNIWGNFYHTITIPDSIKQADLIKIYVYNPSVKVIFIDDFKIKFE